MFVLTYATSVAVVLAGLMEGLGVPWPGALVVAGAAVGTGNGTVAVSAAAGLFTAGYCTGSLVQYLIGWVAGPLALSWLPQAQRVKLEALMAKQGTAAVLWLRPMAVGNYVSLPAGMMRMRLVRFVLYTVLGITPWAAGMAVAGRLLGSQVQGAGALLGQWAMPVLVVAGAAGALWSGAQWLRCRRAATAAAVNEAEPVLVA